MSNISNANFEHFQLGKLQELIILLPEGEGSDRSDGLHTLSNLSSVVNYLWLDQVKDYVLTIPEKFNPELRSIINEYDDLPLGELLNKPIMKKLHVKLIIRPHILIGAIHVAICGDGVNDLSEDHMLFMRKTPEHLLGGYPSNEIKGTTHIAIQEPIVKLFTSTDRKVFTNEIGVYKLDGKVSSRIYEKIAEFGEKAIELFLARRNKSMDWKKWSAVVGEVYGDDAVAIFKQRMMLGFDCPVIALNKQQNGPDTYSYYFYIH